MLSGDASEQVEETVKRQGVLEVMVATVEQMVLAVQEALTGKTARMARMAKMEPMARMEKMVVMEVMGLMAKTMTVKMVLKINSVRRMA